MKKLINWKTIQIKSQTSYTLLQDKKFSVLQYGYSDVLIFSRLNRTSLETGVHALRPLKSRIRQIKRIIRVICVADSSSNISPWKHQAEAEADTPLTYLLGVLYFYARVSVPETGTGREVESSAIFPAWLDVAETCRKLHGFLCLLRDNSVAFAFKAWPIAREAPKLRKMWVFVGVSERGTPSANTNQVILVYVWLPHIGTYVYIYIYIHTSVFSRAENTCPFLSTHYWLPEVAATNVRPPTIDRGISPDTTGSFTLLSRETT